MDVIYIITGLCTVAGAISGLVLNGYLERRRLTSKKSKSRELTEQGLEADGLST